MVLSVIVTIAPPSGNPATPPSRCPKILLLALDSEIRRARKVISNVKLAIDRAGRFMTYYQFRIFQERLCRLGRVLALSIHTSNETLLSVGSDETSDIA